MTGKAYGLFDCGASKEEIGSCLPIIRNLSQIPEKVGLYLTEDAKSSEDDFRYKMEAVYPGATNEAAAVELTTGLNQAYQSHLWKNGEPFRGRAFYEKDGIYVDMP